MTEIEEDFKDFLKRSCVIIREYSEDRDQYGRVESSGTTTSLLCGKDKDDYLNDLRSMTRKYPKVPDYKGKWEIEQEMDAHKADKTGQPKYHNLLMEIPSQSVHHIKGYDYNNIDFFGIIEKGWIENDEGR